MNNERCSYHSGNSKSFRNSVSGTGDENQKCISYCITISFPHEKHYYLLLQDLNQLKKIQTSRINSQLCLQCPSSSSSFSTTFPLDVLRSGDTKPHSVPQTSSTPSGIQKFTSLSSKCPFLTVPSPGRTTTSHLTLHSSGKTRQMVGADTFTLQS